VNRYDLIESQRAGVPLAREQAQALLALGKKLASKTGWWGDPEETPPASVIDISQGPDGEWSVLVREAVGVVSVDGLELVVSPKIPYNHFLYLAAQSGILPRIETQRTEIAPTESLWEVIAHWFVHAAEMLLRGELAKGYRETSDELEHARGRILPLETARLFYQGRPSVACEFEEFSEDIALNRLVRAACDRVAASALLPRELRQRARAGLARMTDVGLLQDADFRAKVDRLTHRYADTIAFAKVLLRGGGTRIAHGAAHGWCFLIRTPELVEAGIRAVLQRALNSRYTVQKKGRKLAGSTFTLNPDLVFGGGLAVGDVKYKNIDPEWSRSDLYQVVAFAAGFDCDRAVIVGFSNGSTAGPIAIRFGKIGVEAFAWDVSPSSEPEASGTVLAAQIAAFLARAARQPARLSST